VILIIGPARPIEREHKAVQQLSPIRPGVDRAMQEPLIVVATQTIEAGVDIDLDGLVTEAAALDALRQRFGRVNRAGRSISPISAITVHKADIGAKANDPVYGDRIVKTWAALLASAGPTNGTINFGIDAFPQPLITGADNLASPKPDAPVLLPAYADLWSHTSPVPNADPEIALFLHGPDRSPASIQIVWRADIAEADLVPANRERLIELFKLVPPRAAEAIELPLWTARAWLGRRQEALAYLSDATEFAPELDDRQQTRRVFRYAGADDPRTGSVNAGELRPGDLIIVPADYGGCDEWGWSPETDEPVYDVAEAASWAYRGRRLAVRVKPELIRQEFMRDGDNDPLPDLGRIRENLSSILAANREENAGSLLNAVLGLEPIPQRLRELLQSLGSYKRRLERSFDVYGYDDEEHRRESFSSRRLA
jgi:CRISPR-associated endonuclease/helicase Cas3